MSVWNISTNYVLVPLKFNLNWNIWNPFLKTSPLDFSGQRLGNTSLVVFLLFHSFSQVVKWPKFVRIDTTNILHVQWQISLTRRDLGWQSWGLGCTPDRHLYITTLFYIPVCILSSKTNNFAKDSQPKTINRFFNVSRTWWSSISRASSCRLNELTAVLCSTWHSWYFLLKQFIRGLMGSLPR